MKIYKVKVNGKVYEVEVEAIDEEKMIEELVNDLSGELDGIGDDLEELGEMLDQEFSNIVNN